MTRALYTDIESFVYFNGVSSEAFTLYQGSGQGRILAPFMYKVYIKDVRVQAPITCIKLGIPIYFIDHSEFTTTAQCKKILSRANNEIKCFEFSSIKRALRPHLRTIIAI